MILYVTICKSLHCQLKAVKQNNKDVFMTRLMQLVKNVVRDSMQQKQHISCST